jgi:hypothetical protein
MGRTTEMDERKPMDEQNPTPATKPERKSFKEVCHTIADHIHEPKTMAGKITKKVVTGIGIGLAVIGGIALGGALINSDTDGAEEDCSEETPFESKESEE